LTASSSKKNERCHENTRTSIGPGVFYADGTCVSALDADGGTVGSFDDETSRVIGVQTKTADGLFLMQACDVTSVQICVTVDVVDGIARMSEEGRIAFFHPSDNR
jgi:hypothetical protein